MTVEDIKALKDDFITPAQAASVMKMDVSRVIGYAREGKLPFDVLESGNRVKISRRSFLAWAEGKKSEPEMQGLMKELHYTNVQLTGIATMLMVMTQKFVPELKGWLESMVDELKGGQPQ